MLTIEDTKMEIFLQSPSLLQIDGNPCVILFRQLFPDGYYQLDAAHVSLLILNSYNVSFAHLLCHKHLIPYESSPFLLGFAHVTGNCSKPNLFAMDHRCTNILRRVKTVTALFLHSCFLT